MYDFIVNPLTGHKAKTSSLLGREIIRNYMYAASGGYSKPPMLIGGVENCGKFVCEHDVFDFDDIETPCVAAGESACTSCENIHQFRKLDAHAFNEDPLQKLFNIKGSTKQLDEFWVQLHQTCGISKPTAQEHNGPGLMEVVGADIDLCESNVQAILLRMGIFRRHEPRLLKKMEIYLEAFMEMVLLVPIWNERIAKEPNLQEEDFQASMRQDILAIIMKYKLSFGGAHHPREIPLAISIYLDELSQVSDLILLESIKYITKQKGCAEGVLQLAIDKVQISQGHG